MLRFFDRFISFCFYALFLIVPLTFAGDTSELFEFNKMWLTYGLAIGIFVGWTGKMILQKQIKIQRTILDIPLGLFLLSQIVSTFISLDPYVSFWGYYSRFNGGLLSIITYIFLYYAFVSNTTSVKQVMRYVYASIIAGVLVSLWGLPSHFGYDPTCLVFRGTFDVSCWTVAFQPKIRIFSTLGQPDWLAAYLVLLAPLSFACGAYFAKQKKMLVSLLFFAATFLFYIDTLYTRARSGFIGMGIALVLLVGWYAWVSRAEFRTSRLKHLIQSNILLVSTLVVIIVTTFFLGTAIAQLDKFSYSGLQQFFASKTESPATPAAPSATSTPATPAAPVGELGGTDSGKIRLFVWQGALEIFASHPIFGSGVETFAYAYYQHRPVGHNLTSEWDYLYNKAHNEYLNYLATTGIFGLGTYLGFIVLFLWKGWATFLRKKDTEPLPSLMIPAFFASFISILVTDFFGFSVVNTNIYLFLLPAFVFFFEETLPHANHLLLPIKPTQSKEVSGIAWLGITILSVVGGYLLLVLIQYRSADIAYALGQNLDHAGQYQQAYPLLHQAVQQRPDEPVFKDETSLNDAVLAGALMAQKDTASADKLGQEAIQLSSDVTTNHPNNLVYWKTRVRIAYTLAQSNPSYLGMALQSIEKAQILGPTDAKISYNLGLLYAQTGNLDKAITTLQNTVAMKSNYRDAYYALALFYRQKATNNGKLVVDEDSEKKAVDTMHDILLRFEPHDDQAIIDTLKSWGEQ